MTGDFDEFVPQVGDLIRIKRRFGSVETGLVRSSWSNLREGYVDLDRKGRCHECGQPTPRGERFRYDEVEPVETAERRKDQADG